MPFKARASLVRWQSRVIVRQALLTRAERDLTQARKANVHPRTHLVTREALRRKQLAEAVEMVSLRKDQIATGGVPVIVGGWHPNATRVPYGDAGTFTGAPKRIVWHTTETLGLPNYGGSAPHFTLEPTTGKLWQHYPITVSSRALVHPPECETNRAGALQVELLGFAATTQDWSESAYERIATLARWLEKHGDVKRSCGVTFRKGATRFTVPAWLNYNGHCGHEHVTGNFHWDPGALRIDRVLKGGGA